MKKVAMIVSCQCVAFKTKRVVCKKEFVPWRHGYHPSLIIQKVWAMEINWMEKKSMNKTKFISTSAADDGCESITSKIGRVL